MTEERDIQGGKIWIPVKENSRCAGVGLPPTITKMLPLPQLPAKKGMYLSLPVGEIHTCETYKVVLRKADTWPGQCWRFLSRNAPKHMALVTCPGAPTPGLETL